jgi:hypothetical protein
MHQFSLELELQRFQTIELCPVDVVGEHSAGIGGQGTLGQVGQDAAHPRLERVLRRAAADASHEKRAASGIDRGKQKNIEEHHFLSYRLSKLF